MRTIQSSKIKDECIKLILKANVCVDKKTLDKIMIQKEKETGLAKEILTQIIENDNLAQKENIPLCQDTGIAIFFLEIGQDVHIEGNLNDAINEAVKIAYTEGYFRKSVVKHPLDRVNTNDNTKAIIHTNIVSGDKMKITFAPKGAGSENMSQIKMLVPSDGIEGVKKFVIDTVKKAGGKPCPPIIVGVGIGGNFEKCALLAKEAILRDIDDTSADQINASLERELLEEINKLNIGPMGLGGKTTALAVKVNSYPCHIASLPVAVNIQCHAARHEVIIL